MALIINEMNKELLGEEKLFWEAAILRAKVNIAHPPLEPRGSNELVIKRRTIPGPPNKEICWGNIMVGVAAIQNVQSNQRRMVIATGAIILN